MTAYEPRLSGLPTAGAPRADPAELLSLFGRVASASSVGLGFIDRTLRVTSINSVFASVNGGAAEDQVARLLKEVVPGLWPQLERLDQRAGERHEPVVTTEIAGELPEDPRT